MNSEMSASIANSPTFSAIYNEVAHEREAQAMRHFYIKTVQGQIAGQESAPFFLTLDQGADFQIKYLTASAFSYDDAVDTSFPIPNSLGVTAWAGRGLSIQLTDTGKSKDITDGFVPLELIGAPGYGLNFQHPFPLKYYATRNSKIRVDVRNRDLSTRTHDFAIAFIGYRILVP